MSAAQKRRKQGRTISLSEEDYNLFWKAIEKTSADGVSDLTKFLEEGGRAYARKVLNDPTPLEHVLETVLSMDAKIDELQTQNALLRQQITALTFRLNECKAPNDTQPIGSEAEQI